MVEGFRRTVGLVLCVVALTACVRTNVARTDERTVYISANGTAFNSSLDVYKRVLTEGAKATLAAGYDYFMIESNVNTGHTNVIISPGQAYTTATVNTYGNSAYGTAHTTYTPPTATPVYLPGQDVKIHFYRASEVTPDMQGIKDAHWIVTHLQ